MASPNILTKATGSTLLLKLLFRSNPSRAMFAPFTPRSLHTVDTKLPKSDDETTDLYGTYTKNNPFQSLGPREAYVIKQSEEGIYLRVDMPGVGKDDVKVWVEKESVFFKGKAPKESEHEDGRDYGGSIDLYPGWCKKDVIRADVKNGTVRIMMPRIKLEDREDVIRIPID